MRCNFLGYSFRKRKRREKYRDDSDGESYLTNSSKKSRKPDDRRDHRRDRERRRDRDRGRGRDRDRDRRSTEHLERPRDRPVRMNDYQSDPEYRSARPRPRQDARPRRGDYEERRRRDNYNERDRRRDYEERPRRGEYEVPRRRNEDTRLDGSNEYLTARNVPIRRRYNEELPPPPEEEDAHYERLSVVADPVFPDLIMDSQNAESRMTNDGTITGVHGYGSTQEQDERLDQNNPPQYDKNNPPKPTPRRMIRPRGDGIPGRLSSKRRNRGNNPDGSTRRKPRRSVHSMRSMASSVYSYDDEGDDWGDDWDDDDDDGDDDYGSDSEAGYDRLADFIEEEEADAAEAASDPNYVNTEPDYANSQVQSAIDEPDYENQRELQEVQLQEAQLQESQLSHSKPTTATL